MLSDNTTASSDLDWKQIEVKKRIKKEESKPKINLCSNCKSACFSFECKSCFLKRQKECKDCNKHFSAVMQNGTTKIRCKECHIKFNSKNMKACVGCKKSIQGCLNDGKIVDKCVNCYKASFNYCPCGGRTYKDNKLCSPCYKEQLKIEDEQLKEKERQSELLLAKIEHEKNINILDGYFISKCKKCKKTSKGNFKICIKCKEQDIL